MDISPYCGWGKSLPVAQVKFPQLYKTGLNRAHGPLPQLKHCTFTSRFLHRNDGGSCAVCSSLRTHDLSDYFI